MIPATQNWLNYTLRPAVSAMELVHVLKITGYGRTFSWTKTPPANDELPWVAAISGAGVNVDAARGSAQNAALSIGVVDYQNVITRDVATTTFEGMSAQLLTGFAGLDEADFLSMGSFIIDTVETQNANNRYRFNLRDPGLKLQQTVFLFGDDAFRTSDAHPLTLTGDPMTILTNVLETQCGYASGDLNMTAINAYQTGLFNGLEMRFSITQPAQAKAWLEQEIFSPLAGYGFWNSLGQYTPYFLTPEPATPVWSFDAKSIADPLPTISAGPFTCQLLTMMDCDGQNFQSGVASEYGPGISRYGIQQMETRQSRGLRSALGGSFFAKLAHYGIFRRYGVKPRVLKVKALWPAIRLEAGDAVQLSHPNIPDISGKMGIVNRVYEIQSVQPDWQRGLVNLELLDVNWRATNPLQFAPNSTPDWASATSAEQQQYAYIGEGQSFY